MLMFFPSVCPPCVQGKSQKRGQSSHQPPTDDDGMSARGWCSQLTPPSNRRRGGGRGGGGLVRTEEVRTKETHTHTHTKKQRRTDIITTKPHLKRADLSVLFA